MALHMFHDLTLEVQHDGPDAGAELERLLQNLSFVPTPAGARPPYLRLTVHWQACPQSLPVHAREIFRAEGLCGLAVEADRADRSVLTFVHELAQHQLVL